MAGNMVIHSHRVGEAIGDDSIVTHFDYWC